MALWHAGKVSAAKRAARKEGVSWKKAKREFNRAHDIEKHVRAEMKAMRDLKRQTAAKSRP
jgi:hypothetical protein